MQTCRPLSHIFHWPPRAPFLAAALTLLLPISGCGGANSNPVSTTLPVPEINASQQLESTLTPDTEIIGATVGEALADNPNEAGIEIAVFENKSITIMVPYDIIIEPRLFLKVYDNPFSPVFLGEVIPTLEGDEYTVQLDVSVPIAQPSLNYELFGITGDFETIYGELTL
ncbi:MAG: hypothetical protein H7A01_14370 [Hahellaceae bacterium]|nr:hypothetical protein [Hahellaceae bacterium]MCP5210242.1 hypothetical protein [Hahellaceae bacterium]